MKRQNNNKINPKKFALYTLFLWLNLVFWLSILIYII